MVSPRPAVIVAVSLLVLAGCGGGAEPPRVEAEGTRLVVESPPAVGDRGFTVLRAAREQDGARGVWTVTVECGRPDGCHGHLTAVVHADGPAGRHQVEIRQRVDLERGGQVVLRRMRAGTLLATAVESVNLRFDAGAGDAPQVPPTPPV